MVLYTKKYQKGDTFLNPYGFQEEEFKWEEAPVTPKATNKNKVSEKQKLFNENFKVNKPSNYDIIEQKAKEDLKKLEKFAEEKGIKLTEKDKENSLNAFWRNYGNTLSLRDLNIYRPNEIVTAGKEYTTKDKIINVVRNPFAATAYFMKPGSFDMPMNYYDMERAGYVDPLVNNNPILKSGKVLSYFLPQTAALHAVNDLIGTRDDIAKAYKSGKSEDWVEAGKSGLFSLLDIVPGAKLIGRSGRTLNLAESAALETMRLRPPARINSFIGQDLMPLVRSNANSVSNTWQGKLFNQIDPSSNLYNEKIRKAYNAGVVGGKTQDAAQGLDEAFKSEIDWGKWNPEIPQNKPLMDEYLAIEKQAKADGSWMKPIGNQKTFQRHQEIMLEDANKVLETGMLNGTKLTDGQLDVFKKQKNKLDLIKASSEKYAGTPEQFVQELSSNYKKAFGDNADITYRGGVGHLSYNGPLNSSKNKNVGSVFTADKDAAVHYGNSTIMEKGSKDQGLLELLYKKSNNNINLGGQKGRSWSDLYNTEAGKSTDDVAKYIENNNIDYATLENLFDGTNVSKEIIFNHKPGNYLKSRWYNNGMFDMSNPNIYKALAPIGLAGSLLYNKKEN